MTSRVPETFAPYLWLPGAHLQTIVPAFWPGPSLGSPLEPLIVPVAPGCAVRVDLARPTGVAARGTLLLIHGLGGSAQSAYMLHSAHYALSRGWAVALLNLRTCGGTESLSRTLYNAGQSDDAGAVLAALDREGLPRPFAAAGFSLGGNLILRYAGLTGSASLADVVVGLNAPIDLDACLRELERTGNAPYELNFVLRLCRQVGALRALRPVSGPPAIWWRIRRLRRFDDLFTAPDAGFRSSAEYYAAASAAPTLPGIRVPTLVLSASNDPFVPIGVFETARRTAAAKVSFRHPRHGGHVGYWQRGSQRFWAATALMEFIEGSGSGGRRA